MPDSRSVRLAAVAGLAALALAGCSSGSRAPSGKSTAGTFGLRYGDAPALLTQCGLTSGAIKAPVGQPWFADGKVLPLSGPGHDSHASELATWWNAHESTKVGGHTLAYWQQWAAQHDGLPLQVCGTLVSAPALQRKLAPGQPNPWGA